MAGGGAPQGRVPRLAGARAAARSTRLPPRAAPRAPRPRGGRGGARVGCAAAPGTAELVARRRITFPSDVHAAGRTRADPHARAPMRMSQVFFACTQMSTNAPQMPLPPLSRLTLDTTTHHAPGPPLESLLREGGRRARRRRAHQLVGLDCRRGRGPRGLHAVPRNVLLVELHLLVREQAPVHHLLDRVLVHVHADKHDLLAAVPGRHVVVVPGREGVSVQ